MKHAIYHYWNVFKTASSVVLFCLCLMIVSSFLRGYAEKTHAQTSCVEVAVKNPHHTVDCYVGYKLLD